MQGLLARSPVDHAAAIDRLRAGSAAAFDSAIGETTVVGMDMTFDVRERYGDGWQVVHPQGFLGGRLPARAWRELAALRVVAAAPEGTRAAGLRREIRRVLLRYPAPQAQADDVGWLTTLPIEELVLSNVEAAGFSRLGELPGLHRLWLSWCTLDAAVEQLGAAGVRTLRADGVIGRIGDLTRMSDLRRVELSATEHTDLSGFRAGASELKLSGDVRSDQVREVLAGLPELRVIELDHVDTVPDLSGCPLVHTVRLERPSVTELLGLPRTVTRLYVRFGDQLQTLAGVGALPGLRVLGLYHCRRLTSLAGIERHPALAVLDLRGIGGLTSDERLLRFSTMRSLAAVAIAGSGLGPGDLPPEIRDASPTAMQVDLDVLERVVRRPPPATSPSALLESEDLDAIDVGVDALVESGGVSAALRHLKYSPVGPEILGTFDFPEQAAVMQASGALGGAGGHALRALVARAVAPDPAMTVRETATTLRIDGAGGRVDLHSLRAFPQLRHLVIENASEVLGLAELDATRSLRLVHCALPVQALPPGLTSLDVARTPIAPLALGTAPGLRALRMRNAMLGRPQPDLRGVALERLVTDELPDAPIPGLTTLGFVCGSEHVDDALLSRLLRLGPLTALNLHTWPTHVSLRPLGDFPLETLVVVPHPVDCLRPIHLPDMPALERLVVGSPVVDSLHIGEAPRLRHLRLLGSLHYQGPAQLATLDVPDLHLPHVRPETAAGVQTLIVRLRPRKVSAVDLWGYRRLKVLVAVAGPGADKLKVQVRGLPPGCVVWEDPPRRASDELPLRPVAHVPAHLRVC